MTRRTPRSPAELVTDSGVLEPTSTLEFFDSAAVAEVGGVAILPHRGRWLRARGLGIEAHGWLDDADGQCFDQAVVHLQKGRAATEQALAEAWRRLRTGGRLLLVGGNELGVKTAVKRLAAELATEPRILANRARARVACWPRSEPGRPDTPSLGEIPVADGDDAFKLVSAPGVFSADAVDPGSALLLAHLDRLSPPERLFDPGCGIGVLGLAGLRRWPGATAVLADVDYRSIHCARRNASRLGLDSRCTTVWWDAVTEPPPADRCDLVLVNPPFHSGVPVDLQPARRIFDAIEAALVPGGRALVVANRTLPWERELRPIGTVRQIDDRNGYKVLEIRR
jgi:16S rRNA (guanine1207-N2)-methyltransferase